MTEIPTNDKDIHENVDDILAMRPDTLKLVKENRKFIHDISNKKIPTDKAIKSVHGGYIKVDLNAILKNNIYNHTIFTIEKICRLYRNMSFEQLKKYQKRKNPINMNYLFFIIIIIIIIFGLFIVFLILPGVMGSI